MAWDDYSGLDEIVGADEPYQRAAGGALQRAGTSVQGAAVRSRGPRALRQYPLGFSKAAVAPSATVQVISRPQVTFRPQRIVIPASVASNFSIADVRIGKNSQLVSSDELPAELFLPDAVNVLLALDTANIGQDVELTVRNLDASNSQDFRGAMIGTAAE